MRTGTRAAIAGMAITLGATTAAATAGANERMQLHCELGTLGGRTLERTNGSSWWDVDNGDLYTTGSIVVSEGAETVYAKQYGKKTGGAPATCTAAHFDFTWDLVLVRARG